MLKYIFVIFPLFAIAQNSQIIIAPGSDTLIHPYLKEQNDKLGFDDISDDRGDHTFRFAYYGTAITVYEYAGKSFGNVRMGVFELGDEGRTGKTFAMTFSLKPEQVIDIFKLLDTLKIDSLPTDEQIKEWEFGFDGITYCLEHKSKGIYSRKNYWTPRAQGYLPEALLVEQFKNDILNIVGMETLYKTFERQIPFRAWTNGSGMCVSRPLTSKEYRELKRERRKRVRENN